LTDGMRPASVSARARIRLPTTTSQIPKLDDADRVRDDAGVVLAVRMEHHDVVGALSKECGPLRKICP
jgi:hypothetical protein